MFWRVFPFNPFNFNYPDFPLLLPFFEIRISNDDLLILFGFGSLGGRPLNSLLAVLSLTQPTTVECWLGLTNQRYFATPRRFEIIALILSINQSKPRNESRDSSELRQVCVCEKQSLISPQNSGKWLGKKLILLTTDFVFLFLLLTEPASHKTEETSFSSLHFCVAQEEWCYSRRLDGK